jgi:hypothetical protein
MSDYYHINLSSLKDWTMDIREILYLIRRVVKNEKGIEYVSSRLYSP